MILIGILQLKACSLGMGWLYRLYILSILYDDICEPQGPTSSKPMPPRLW